MKEYALADAQHPDIYLLGVNHRKFYFKGTLRIDSDQVRVLILCNNIIYIYYSGRFHLRVIAMDVSFVHCLSFLENRDRKCCVIFDSKARIHCFFLAE